jgi:hypothetical protein
VFPSIEAVLLFAVSWSSPLNPLALKRYFYLLSLGVASGSPSIEAVLLFAVSWGSPLDPLALKQYFYLAFLIRYSI